MRFSSIGLQMSVANVPFVRKKVSQPVYTIEAASVDAQLINTWAASMGISYSVSSDDTSCRAGETGCSWDGKHISDDN